MFSFGLDKNRIKNQYQLQFQKSISKVKFKNQKSISKVKFKNQKSISKVNKNKFGAFVSFW